MTPLQLDVNGTRRTVESTPGATLLRILREQLDLTGAKYACGEGQCGACVVLLDGVAVPACMTTGEQAVGKRVTTIEGLSKGPDLHPVQEAFIDKSAFQCGFCAPGMILASVALLTKDSNPAPEKIRRELNGHICRCGAYPRIVEAVRHAARSRKNG